MLVTGGAGYIGSHVSKALKAAGYLPVVYDSLHAGFERMVKWGPFVKGDIGDKESLLRTLREYKPLGVIHMAALTDARESVQNPGAYYTVNLSHSITLLNAMVEAGVKSLIFSSTAAIYGHSEGEKITEEDPKQPINPYGQSKWMVEQLLDDYEHAYGLKHACLRYFNAAGADPDGEIGESHSPPSHLIPIVLDHLLTKQRPFRLFGNQYPTKDGSAIRDFIHVSDLADAHVRALSYLSTHDTSLHLNLGSGAGFSVLEVIQEAEKLCGKCADIVIEPAKQGDPHTLICCNREAETRLGWTPKHSSLKTLIETTLRWQEKQ